MIAIEEKADSIIVPFKIITKASRNAVGEEYNKVLKLYITAPPIEGKANKQIIKFLSKYCRLPQKDIRIITGHTSSLKRIELKMSKASFLSLLDKG